MDAMRRVQGHGVIPAFTISDLPQLERLDYWITDNAVCRTAGIEAAISSISWAPAIR